jgi:hypothetical protein
MRAKRKPARLAIVMSDGTIEPVDLAGLATLDVDDRSDIITLRDALRIALNRIRGAK